ncbi:MAG TPA: DNA-formamidopyrimidine glycosylase [Blastocatellia bacterium]|nr:DNA-formamidopyrimidine glycosylase [Blastocatellia bacterium]
MPELPEVETRLNYFRSTALGQQVERVLVSAPNLIKSETARIFARKLRDRRFVEAHRRGKYLIITLDDGRALILHFGMGGDLHYYQGPRERPEYTRIEFVFTDGRRLAFTCPRKICRVMLVDDVGDVPALREMGPEPAGKHFSLAYLERLCEASPNRRIKPLLMDQRKIAGVGNIYADEILFASRVRPDRRASSLSDAELRRIHRETRRVLRRAIETAADEEFPSDFLVSRDWRGAGCKRCGAPIERKKINGRTAHFCPNCQL